MSAPGWLTARPIAHRGLHDAVAGPPENSLAAAEAAIAAGYAIEVDIRPSGDGVAMVFHDATLERLTGASGRLDARPCTELRRLSIGGSGERIASLDDLLGTVAGRAALIIEIKTDGATDGAFERTVCARLTRYHGPAALMSFEPSSLAAVARAAPQIPRGLISMAYRGGEERARLGAAGCWARRNLIPALKTGAGFIAYDARALPAAAPAIARMVGLPVLTWTVRSETEQRRIARHADQIIFEGFRPLAGARVQ